MFIAEVSNFPTSVLGFGFTAYHKSTRCTNRDIGSPGPDRVIINTSGKLAGEITHTGASGNNFVGCSGTS